MQILKSVLHALLAMMLIAGAGYAAAQPAYPSKPIRLIVPFPPGGSTTVVARVLSQRLQEAWGQPVVVENRPGANGVIGAEELMRSPPDGHTIMLVVNTFAINAVVMKNLPYDTVRDFAPVSTLYSFELVLVGHPSIPANNLKEFIALAKAKPNAIRYASGDNGGLTHLASEMFNTTAGVKLQNVPYKGSGPALTDTVAGHVESYFSSVTAALPFIKGGRLRAFAISGKTRSPALPEVPTFAEQGLPDFDASSWAGILAPANTPKEIVAKLSAEIARIMAMPDVQQQLSGQGLDAMALPPERFGALIGADIEKYGRVIKAANIKFDN
jgi:tripartite-type tricarboxylate transporter receptor subunit TctC